MKKVANHIRMAANTAFQFNCINGMNKFSGMIYKLSNRSDYFPPNKYRVKEIQLLLVLYVVRNKALLELGYYRVTDSSSEFVNLEDLPTDQLLSRNHKLCRLLLISLCIIIFITYVLALSIFSSC